MWTLRTDVLLLAALTEHVGLEAHYLISALLVSAWHKGREREREARMGNRGKGRKEGRMDHGVCCC